MGIVFTQEAKNDLAYWRSSDNTGVQKRIETLLKDMQAHPYFGIGKPEILKYSLSGFWSRRITREHRIVYYVENELIMVVSCRFHY